MSDGATIGIRLDMTELKKAETQHLALVDQSQRDADARQRRSARLGPKVAVVAAPRDPLNHSYFGKNRESPDLGDREGNWRSLRSLHRVCRRLPFAGGPSHLLNSGGAYRITPKAADRFPPRRRSQPRRAELRYRRRIFDPFRWHVLMRSTVVAGTASRGAEINEGLS
jgi:hypothetical protein